MFPFWQYMGLASKRVLDLATTKGSRGRTMAALAAVPVATMMWNHRNADYTKVEEALPTYLRDVAHVIVPDPRDPEKPLLDTTGKPVIVPMRWMITEQVAQMFGLGNMAERTRRAVTGRDKPLTPLTDIPKNLMSNVQQQAMILNIAGSIVSGKDQLTGEQTPRGELLAKSLPLGRDLVNTYKAAKNYGAAAAGQVALQRATGTTLLTPIAKGRKDADIVDLISKRNDARKKMRSAYKKGDIVEAQKWEGRLRGYAKDIQRVNAARKRGQ
jgi:hypothetical protein